jgi:phosphate acetyltransferase
MDSNSNFLNSVAHGLRGKNRRLVFPEGADRRILEAARFLHDGQLARVSLLGCPDEIHQAARGAAVSLDGFRMIDPARDDRGPEFARLYQLGRPRTREAVAQRLVRKPLFFGGMLVRSGAADALLAGIANPTARVVEAGLMTVGLAPGTSSPSSFFLLMLPDRPTIFADCALSIDPSEQQLAEIALACAKNYSRLFDDPPRVALLSFSTQGSARHEMVEKVRRAVDLARQHSPGVLIDGEMQLDTALDPDVAGQKLKHSSAISLTNWPVTSAGRRP